MSKTQATKNTQNKSRILTVSQDGGRFTLKVLVGGQKERWVYETDNGREFIQVSREHVLRGE